MIAKELTIKQSSMLDDFNEDSKKYSAIYEVHKYWARKPWRPIRNSITKYSKIGDTVVDLFLGSGVTALESIIIRRNFIGFDLNPMSIFITENTIFHDFDESEFKHELLEIKKCVENTVNDLYLADTKCENCNEPLMLDHLNIGPKFGDSIYGYFYCLKCGKEKTKTKLLVDKEQLRKSFQPRDLTFWYPDISFPKKFYKDRFSYKGIKNIADMYTPRNFYFLSYLLHVLYSLNLKYRKLFLLAFSNTVLHASKLKGENVRPLGVNNYWIPDDYIEENPWTRFEDRVSKVLKAKKILKERIKEIELGDYKLYNQSSVHTGIPTRSVDYIITDPPYGEAIQYSELSFVWNAWLNNTYDTKEEVIINPIQNKGKQEFFLLLDKIVKEAKRILKKDKFLTLCFHNKDLSIWHGILNIFKKYKFTLEYIEIEDTLGNSYNKNWASYSPKADIYLTFKKGGYKSKGYEEYNLDDFLKNIKKSDFEEKGPKIYENIIVNLIYEIYYNDYEVDLSKLCLEDIIKGVEDIKNAN
jgi:hypothetical protein